VIFYFQIIMHYQYDSIRHTEKTKRLIIFIAVVLREFINFQHRVRYKLFSF
jgi:hypothetical protein